jgi:capsular exopolysaccharide synthesis family protein
MLAGAGTAAVAWTFVPTRHTARSLLRVDSTRPSILFSNPDDRNNFLNYQRAQLALLKSRMVLNAALRDPKVADLRVVKGQADPVAWLEKEVKADYKLAPEVMQITLAGTTPDGLAAVVNAVRDAYIREIVDKEQTDRQAKLETLKKLYTTYEEQLRDKRRTLRELAESVGTRDAQTLAHKQRFAQERLALSQKELLQLQSDIRKGRVEAASFPARQAAVGQVEVPEALIEEQLQKDPVVTQQMAEIARLEAAYENAKQSFVAGENEPLLRRYRTPIEAARKAIAARTSQVRPALVAQLREKARHDLAVAGAQLKSKLAHLLELEKELAADLKRMESETHTLNKGSIDLESLREEIAHAESVAKQAGAQIETIKVEQQAPARVSVLEEAYVSDADGQKKKLMATGGGGVAAFGLVVCGLVWLDLRARRIGSLNDVKKGLGVRIIGAIPATQDRRKSGWLGGRFGAPSATPKQVLDAVDAARTVLLGTAVPHGVRCVMVTSAVSGEGKTSLSIHLAASLARLGHRTLLVDGDLRAPSVHEHLTLAPGAGLGEVLRGEASLAEAIRSTPMSALWVLPGGRPDKESVNALAREKGQTVFRALRDGYDFVVVDSSPVLPVADALLLSRHVDGVVFSLLRDVSCVGSVSAACERVSVLGGRVLGVVVNGLAGDHPGIRYESSSLDPKRLAGALPN